jgi:hypothetical protein
LPDGIKAFFNNEQVSSFFKNQPEEKRLKAIKNLGNLLVAGTVSSAMMILTALTFGHAISPGYPGEPEEAEKGARKLESKSYQVPIGVADSILSVGKLTGSILKQSAHEITSSAEIFDFMDTDTSGLFKPGPTTG